LEEGKVAANNSPTTNAEMETIKKKEIRKEEERKIRREKEEQLQFIKTMTSSMLYIVVRWGRGSIKRVITSIYALLLMPTASNQRLNEG
jgi:hypothetical protein